MAITRRILLLTPRLTPAGRHYVTLAWSWVMHHQTLAPASRRPHLRPTAPNTLTSPAQPELNSCVKSSSIASPANSWRNECRLLSDKFLGSHTYGY